MWSTLLVVTCCCVVAQSSECILGEDGEYYSTEVIPTNYSLRHNVAGDWKNNKIYMLATSLGKKYYVVEYDINDGKFKFVAEVPFAFSLTVDQRRGRLYAGCFSEVSLAGGLFTFDSNVQQFQRLTEEQEPIRMVHFADDVLYYTDHIHYKLQMYAHGHCKPESNLTGSPVLSFVIDGNGDKVFTTVWDVFHQKVDKTAVVNVKSGKSIEHVAVDPNGDVYGCGPPYKYIFRINTTDSTVSKVLRVQEGVHSFTFDKEGNFVFVNIYNHNLIRIMRCKS